MTKIVLNIQKNVDEEQAETLKFVIKRAVTDYLATHVPLERFGGMRLSEDWHKSMHEAEKVLAACMLLISVKIEDIQIEVTK